MNIKRDVLSPLSLLLFVLLPLIAQGITMEEGAETAFKDVSEISQVPDANQWGDGTDISSSQGNIRITEPIETPIRTNLGDISDAKLEDSIFSFGDLVNGKIESFIDNNIIPIQSISDPDLSIDIIMNKDGKATVTQYDKYGKTTISMAIDPSSGTVLQEVSKEFGKLSKFVPNKDAEIAHYERKENKVSIESGTLSFSKDDWTESVTALTNASKPTEITLNKQSGFECVTLQQDGFYSFKSPEKSFSIANSNEQEYVVCINKKEKTVARPTAQRSGYVDLVKEIIELKAKAIYKHDDKIVYHGFDVNNNAVLSLEDKTIVITNRAPQSKISEVRIGHHSLIEEKIDGEIKRYHSFLEQPSPNIIQSYETSFGSTKISVKEKALVQEIPDINNKIVIHEPESMEMGLCLGEMEEVLKYEKVPSENC